MSDDFPLLLELVILSLVMVAFALLTRALLAWRRRTRSDALPRHVRYMTAEEAAGRQPKRVRRGASSIEV